MISGLMGTLSFNAPWMLAGLAALPAIWWLLRLTPPRPQTVPFPPASLLLGLRARERTPVRSPWWLTLLRMLIAAAVIAALAGPVLRPPTAVSEALPEPLAVVVDNGWAAASRWSSRQALAGQLASEAEDHGQTLFLVATAGPPAPLQPLSAPEFRQRFASLTPQGFPSNRRTAALQIGKDLADWRGKVRVAWLSDGVEDEGAPALSAALSTLAPDGTIDFYRDTPGSGALAIAKVPAAGGAIRAHVLKAETSPRSGQVAAVTARGERLAAAPFAIAGAASSAEVALDLPLDLRNQIARLEIVGEGSAGAAYLLDSRSQRRRAGLIAGEGAEDAQPLLSPVYYLERALTPFAEVTRARTANLDQATADLVNGSPSIIILSDVGRLAGPVAERLRAFVEKGGMLIRFAGPRLEQGGDGLLPAPLREGGRTLGGTMTWTSPQTPVPFEQDSPFDGLSVPKDVTVSRQVLSDPAAMPRETKVWARLADGTPLVTAARRGAGMLVFFHITANPDWSNLPISGLFVEMMRKILELAPLQAVQTADSATQSATAAMALSGQPELMKPWRVLDGFGKLTEPGERAQALAVAEIDTARASTAHPAGLYGPHNALRAINTMRDGDALTALSVPRARDRVFAETKTVALAPWLFFAGLLLFLADGAICAHLASPRTTPLRKAAAILALALFAGMAVQDARAESGQKRGDPADFALQASLDTRLAFIVTGNDEADRVSRAGLAGLSKVLNARTAVEPGEPMGVDPARDELVFFPLIYWPVLPNAEPLPDRVLAKIDAYMKQGGLIIFDTKNDPVSGANLLSAGGSTPLAQLLGKLDLPPLQRVPESHVLTKAFYLLQSFPGRWDNGDPWVEAQAEPGEQAKRGVKSDGVSSIIVTSNDLAAAWALDDGDHPMFAAVPGGEEQRELSYRAGVNIVMYALTGNYKADQVHVPAILERLGH